jgi:hypothetical protein
MYLRCLLLFLLAAINPAPPGAGEPAPPGLGAVAGGAGVAAWDGAPDVEEVPMPQEAPPAFESADGKGPLPLTAPRAPRNVLLAVAAFAALIVLVAGTLVLRKRQMAHADDPAGDVGEERRAG